MDVGGCFALRLNLIEYRQELVDFKHTHPRFIATIIDAMVDATEERLNVSALLTYISAWWEKHILDSDMQYKPYLSQQHKTVTASDNNA